MNETAKVIRFYKTGGPEVLRVEDVRWPQPVGNEVLIRVRALALSRLDLLWREGSYCEEPQFPAQIGYEAPPASSSWSALLKRFIRKGVDGVNSFSHWPIITDSRHYPKLAVSASCM
jgi:hypothetical protein